MHLHDRGVARPVRVPARRHHQEAHRRPEPGGRGQRSRRADRRSRSEGRREAPAQGLMDRLRKGRRDGSDAQLDLIADIATRGADEPFTGRATRPRAMTASSTSWSTARPRSSRPGTSCSRAPSPPSVKRHGTFRDVIDAPALRARPRLRRALLSADQPDRQKEPQGQEQHADADRGRCRQRSTHRLDRMAGTMRSIPNSARSRISARLSRRQGPTGWSSRSISPSSARRTIPGSRNIRNGSCGVRTAPSNMPRTRRRKYRGHRQRELLRRGRRCLRLWKELRDVMLFWVREGVRILRVDNPHTKPIPFWRWVIAEINGHIPRRHLPGRGLHPAGR